MTTESYEKQHARIMKVAGVIAFPFYVFKKIKDAVNYLMTIRDQDERDIFGRKMPREEIGETRTQPSRLVSETETPCAYGTMNQIVTRDLIAEKQDLRAESELSKLVNESKYSPFCRVSSSIMTTDKKSAEMPILDSKVKEGDIPCQPGCRGFL